MEIPHPQTPPPPAPPPAAKPRKPRIRTEESWQAKRERDRVLAKTRINIGLAFERWRELRDQKGYRSDAELASFLLSSCSKGKPVAETYYTTPRADWTSSDESTCSASESWNCAVDVEKDGQSPQNGAAACQQNGQTADVQRKPSSRDEEGSCDLSESSYVSLNKEVLVTLMFRCLECSSECRVRGKGKGGNLLFRQECLVCCSYRVWTSQSAQMVKEEVASLPVTSAACDAQSDLSTEQHESHDNSPIKQEERVDGGDVRGEEEEGEEGHATGGVTSFVVKEEKEDDYEREVEGLLMETYVDQVPFSSVQEKPDIEGNGFNVDLHANEATEPPHTSLTAQEEEIPDHFSGEGELDDSENDSKTSVSSSYESTDSSGGEEEERRPEEEFKMKRQKLFQNTIKPIYWCVDCGALARVQCTVRRHQKIFGCYECGAAGDVVGYGFRGFTLHFSDKHSFHKHAIEVHGATENLHERTVCQDCNKTFRVQSDPSKKGHVCEYKVKPFSCHLCRKRFATEVGQKVHYRRLHRDYTHLCKFCMEVFDTRTSKLEHEQTHGEDQPAFLCPDCPAKFKDFIARNQHLKSHRGQKKYTCHKCDRTLSSLSGYERHLLVHSGEKPYTCEVCERSFNQAGHLKSHMRLHTGEKPFMCEQCGECFNHNISLKNHMLRRHNMESMPVSAEENTNRTRPVRNAARKAQRKKRARRSSSSSAAAGELDVELQSDLEESNESDSDKEEKKKRGRRKNARRKKRKATK
ncbi:uncharacterized protein [Salminus brasiliensis]|uniref:uncharacterized protein n=1 Tax=Salminus brasiliensis TaxID=930266 RepID=UPI003B83A597